jgi:Zn ribbon nucleic-acid-binding protein
MKAKFSDPHGRIDIFSDLFLVRCPRCDSCAKVIVRNREDGVPNLFAPRRLSCLQCGYTKDWEGKQITQYHHADWYFGLPLWLQIPCCGEILWAHNQKHLQFLEDFVSAEIRESLNGSLASKLPKWLKSAKNRDEILRTIEKLKTKLEGIEQ